MLQSNNVTNVRDEFAFLRKNNILSENGTYEIVNASFVSNEESIFGKLSKDYIEREIEWYLSQSLSVADIPEPIPGIWKDIASFKGEINSNYGWCIYSDANENQFDMAVGALIDDPKSRQAVMVYIRPTMHADAIRDGMRDFMCTYSTQLMIRNNRLHYIVNMRSNDAVFGYKNDRAWHDFVFDEALKILQVYYPELTKGNLYWNAGSLHVYERHFHLIDEYIEQNKN